MAQRRVSPTGINADMWSSVQRKVKLNPISSLYAKAACTSIAGDPTIKRRYGEILYESMTFHLHLAMPGLS